MIGDDMSKTKMSKIDLIIHFIVKVKRDDIFALASQLAYYLVLSFFPFLMFLFTLIGFINLDSTTVLEALQTILPITVFELVETIILEIVDSQNTGLLGVSVLLAVWTASSGFRAVIKGVNKAYNLHENRNYIRRAIMSFLSIIALAITILLSLSLLVFGDVISKHLISNLPFTEVLNIVWNILRYGVIILILILIFAAIYRYTPAEKVKWKYVLPGAVFTTIGWLIISVVFSFYINNYSNYSRFYGSLAAVFILMIWLFLTSIIFMLGVEINAVLEINKVNKKNK